jgi:hypothetical protein
LKKLSGGSPFRAVMGGRSFTRVSASFRLEPQAFVELGRRWLVTDGITRLEVHQRGGVRVEHELRQLGAERDGLTWRRDEVFTLDELRPLLALDAAVSLVLEGPVRATDAGRPLPYQHASQWTGTPPSSTFELLLGSTARLRLQVPEGSALGVRRLREVAERLRTLHSTPVVERFVRGARGDRPVS